ncbi:hypothetical protein BJ166DRAFT_506478 [Pestalotiopsis sp. NC0098]|nr:hypothetical protein BJ166DRAFT_506478 [Pestalotiopsis sp. NC0098]
MLVQTHEHRGFQLHIHRPPSRTVAFVTKSSPRDLIQSLVLLGMRQTTAESLTQNERKAILNLVSYGFDYRKEPTACNYLIDVYQAPSAQRYHHSGAPAGSEVSLEVHVQTLLDNTFPLADVDTEDEEGDGQDRDVLTPSHDSAKEDRESRQRPQLSRLQRLLETPPSSSPVIRSDLVRGNHKQHHAARPKEVGDAGRIAAAGPKAIKDVTQREDDSDGGDRVPLSDTTSHADLDDVSRLFLTPEEQSTIDAAVALLEQSTTRKRPRE